MAQADFSSKTPDQSVVRIGLVQHCCTSSTEQNIDKTVHMIRQAAQRGAQIVATQELFAHTYFPQTENTDHFQWAQSIPGPTSRRLCRLASELGIEITTSLFEKRTQGLYHNTSVMISPHNGGRIISVYRKMHIPDDPGFYEKFYFTPGDASDCCGAPETQDDSRGGWKVQRTRHAQTGMLVCWDQWFPEAARLTALKGAQILFYPTAIGWAETEPPEERARQMDAWQTVQRAHAISNGVFVAAINRVGIEGQIEFWGSSFIADPGGKILVQASDQQEQVLVADCDLSLIDEYRQAWPFLRDRRIDAYAGLSQRYLDHPTRGHGSESDDLS